MLHLLYYFLIFLIDYVCFNDFLVSLHTLHPFPSNVFLFYCKHGAFTIGGSTDHTLWFNRPRNWGLLNRAVREKSGPSYRANKSDISCFNLNYVFMHHSNVCLYAKAELNPSRKYSKQ